MEPRIQYAKTEDGIDLAYAIQGEGKPLVYIPGAMFSHLQISSQIPYYRDWFEALSEKVKLIRYDRRGTGLSDRDVGVHDLDTYVTDLETVVEAAGVDQIVLFASTMWGALAIMYAVRYRERVSQLILFGASAKGSDVT